VRSFVETVKFAVLEHPETEFVRSEFFSFLDFLLQNPFVGIVPSKTSKIIKCKRDVMQAVILTGATRLLPISQSINIT
jgi:hypothetical protein